MLKSFSIERFRLFRSLELTSLGQVNLIVGKNNSGKSAFLEAIQIFTAEPSPRLLWDLAAFREKTWRGEVIEDDEDNPVRHLFRGHGFPGLGEEGIVLGSGRGEDRIHICVAAYRREFDKDGVVSQLARLEPEEAETSDPAVEVYLISETRDRTRQLFPLGASLDRPGFWNLRTWEGRQRVQVVPTRSVPSREIAGLWDSISLTPLEAEVLAGLKLIDESIEDVAFVEDRGRGSRMPLVRTTKFDEPVPLNSMGDGVSRLFQIVLALANVKDGVLLMDEFENGLHWTIQPRVWEAVFRLAARLNVQVFATTHSRDCVEAFHSAWQTNPDSGAFFRLSVDDQGEVRPVAYDLETLGDAVDTRVEVR